MGVFFRFLLLTLLAVGGHQVKGDTLFAKKYGAGEKLFPGYWPVLDGPRFPVEPQLPIGGPVGTRYLPYKPNVPHQHHDYLPQGPLVPEHQQQHCCFPKLGPLVPHHQEQHGDHLPQGPQQHHQGDLPQGPIEHWQYPHSYPQQVPTVLQYHGYPIKMPQHYDLLPQDPKLATRRYHHYGFLPQDTKAPTQYLYYATHVDQEPGVPVVPKPQQHGYPPQ
ncbi:hypothetical protein CHARACLAT_030692, partial [Characodon lateralis]|nr:hypothetical protein [Characodon lateralis]